jgi:hypothetical protein
VNEVLFYIEVTPLLIIAIVLGGIILLQLLRVFKTMRPGIRKASTLIQGGYYQLENNSIVYIKQLLAYNYSWTEGRHKGYNVEYFIDGVEHIGMKDNLRKYLNSNNARMINTEEGRKKLLIIESKLKKI